MNRWPEMVQVQVEKDTPPQHETTRNITKYKRRIFLKNLYNISSNYLHEMIKEPIIIPKTLFFT